MDEVWTASQWGKEVMVHNGLKAEKVEVVPEGVDPDIYYPNPKKKDQSTFTFLSVGKWEARKGQIELCRATIGYEETLAKLMNPKLKTYLSKSKAAGDDVCELTIEYED